MKLYQIIGINETLTSLIDDKDINIPVTVKFKFLGIMKDIQNHIGNYEIVRNELIRTYGKEDENGNFGITKDNDSYEQFIKENNTLLNEDVKVEINKIKAQDIFDANIPAKYLVTLFDFIDGEV